jgi:hypothetical protein
MSLRNLNYPPLVALAGATLSIGLPMLDAALSSSASLTLLKSLNVAAFATNVVAVSVPGRLDGVEDQKMRTGNLNPTQTNATTSANEENMSLLKSKSSSQYTLNPSRSLVNPSGWAFAIWAPIYLGEAAFVAAQVFASDATTAALLPHLTAPFVAANLFQSLWCASFRPSFSKGWERYISAAMLAGTGYSLSLVQSAGSAAAFADSSIIPYLLLPMTIHFGWVSAASLVNLNGSFASNEIASPRSLIALGHSSALIATALGVGLTISWSAPAYGLTLAWSMAACADGMKKRTPSSQSLVEEEALSKAAGVQNILCWSGSLACAAAAAYASL